MQTFIDTVRRRWYALAVVLVAAAGAAYLAVVWVGPTYEATGAVLVMPPASTVRTGTKIEANGNPYLALGGLSQVRDITIRSLTSQETRTELCVPQGDPVYEAMRQSLCGSDPKVSYKVVPDFTNSAPIILVTADADTASGSLVAMQAVTGRVPLVLQRLQQGLNLKTDTTITSAPLVADAEPKVLRKDQIRGGILAGAAVVALGLLLLALVDGLLAARASRRELEAVEEEFNGWWSEEQESSVDGAEPPALSGSGPAARA